MKYGMTNRGKSAEKSKMRKLEREGGGGAQWLVLKDRRRQLQPLILRVMAKSSQGSPCSWRCISKRGMAPVRGIKRHRNKVASFHSLASAWKK